MNWIRGREERQEYQEIFFNYSYFTFLLSVWPLAFYNILTTWEEKLLSTEYWFKFIIKIKVCFVKLPVLWDLRGEFFNATLLVEQKRNYPLKLFHLECVSINFPDTKTFQYYVNPRLEMCEKVWVCVRVQLKTFIYVPNMVMSVLVQHFVSTYIRLECSSQDALYI